MALLEGRGLTKRFGGVVALDGVSFAVERGETVGLIGPNGAGKTTLFRVLTGALAPTEGTVRFDGRDVTDLAPYRRCRLGLVKTHQVVRPFENLTLAENVAVGAEFGAGADDPRAVARETLSFVGLGERADETPEALGVGALKRLEIARALATDPAVLLLDEVAGGLDADEMAAVVDLVEAVADRGNTVFVIDHVMRALMAVSERVLVLSNGSLLAAGTPAEIRDDPEVVEAYLGGAAGGSRDNGSGFDGGGDGGSSGDARGADNDDGNSDGSEGAAGGDSGSRDSDGGDGAARAGGGG